MHSFAKHRHSKSGKASTKITRGLILDSGWRYDLMEWLFDTFLFRGKLRELRQRTADLARIEPGEKVLDVGCGTGTLAMEVARRVGATGRVFGIDPGEHQIGVIEHLDFPNQTFDVVLSTIMMHHLSDTLKRQGLAEIARVLRSPDPISGKPGGRLVIADFKRPEERPAQPVRFGVGGSRVQDLVALVKDAGFLRVEIEEVRLPRFPAHSAGFASFVRADKS